MSEYTPTTDDVRAEYIDRNMFPFDRRMAREAFDRWLAAHDAVVRAMALSEDDPRAGQDFDWGRER